MHKYSDSFDISDTCQSGCTYATPDLAKYPPLVVSLPPQPVFQSPPAGGAGREETPPPPPPPHPNPRDVYAAADMVNIQVGVLFILKQLAIILRTIKVLSAHR